MKTYKIIGKTNGWIASRDSRFNGKCEITIEEGLKIRDAQKKLVEMFNKDYATCYNNWGIVRLRHPFHTSSFKDGTRSYEYDSRTYSIELDKWLIDTKK